MVKVRQVRGASGIIRTACLAAALVPWLAVSGCARDGGGAEPRQPGPARVVASVPPLAGLVEALAPEGADVRSFIQSGQSPHTHEAGPGDLAALARADLVVLVGLGLESSLPSRSLDRERTLVMARALGLEEPEQDYERHEHAADEDDHADDHAGDHVHGPVDPHLWLDPGLVERFVPVLADAVRGALERSGASAEEIDAVESRAGDLLARVQALDREYRERLAPFEGAAIITQHDAWSRLAGRYGLEVVGMIQVAESVEPSAGHIAELVEIAAQHGVRAVFSEPQLDAAVAQRLADRLGVPLGVIDPEGLGGWETMMRANLDELVRVLGGAGEGG